MESHLAGLLAYKSYAVILWFALFFAGERLYSSARPGGAWRWDQRRLARNLGLWLVNVGGSLFVVVPVTVWASGHGLWPRPSWWRDGVGLALDLVLLDFLIYWWHRANHVVPFLWRFHEVHHLDRFLDTTSALRFHVGEVILSALFRAAVIVILAIPITSVLIFETLVLLAALFHHSNVKIPAPIEAALSRIVITPSIHWVHHHAVQRDTDSNYGTILSIWDPLFGSRNRRYARNPEMTIGVERTEELGFLGLLARPFTRRAPLGS